MAPLSLNLRFFLKKVSNERIRLPQARPFFTGALLRLAATAAAAAAVPDADRRVKVDFDALFLLSADVVFALVLRDDPFPREKTDFRADFAFSMDAFFSLPLSELSEKTDFDSLFLLSGDVVFTLLLRD